MTSPEHGARIYTAAVADMVGGHEFLGGDQRMKQRRVYGAEHRHVLGGG